MSQSTELRSLLLHFRLADLDQSDQTVFALRSDLTLAYVNDGWSKFAAQNGDARISEKWPLGSCILKAMTAHYQNFFREGFATCLKEKRPWGHRYECSSPQEFREFKMLAYPLGDAEGFLVIHAPIVTITSENSVTVRDRYADDHELMTQCSHCKRFRRKQSSASWDWVPAWTLICPANTSHGLCPVCYGFYYGPHNQSRRRFPRMFHTHE